MVREKNGSIINEVSLLLEKIKMRHQPFVTGVISLFFAFCTAFAFFMNYADFQMDIFYQDVLYRYMLSLGKHLQNAISGKELLLSLAVIGFFFLYQHHLNNRKYHRDIRFCKILSAVFGAFYVAGTVFLNNIPVFSSKAQTCKLFFAWVGCSFFYYALIHFCWSVVQKDLRHLSIIPVGCKQLFWKHSFAFTFTFLLLCWMIPIILKYPAGICWDASYQIDQGMGNVQLTTHHPVFHTLLMAWATKFGIWIGSANIGIFLFVVVEAIVLALVFSYGINLLVKLRASRWCILFSLFFFGLSPFVTGYVGTVIKDVYFTAFSLLFTIVLAEYTFARDTFWSSWHKPLVLILAALGMVLFRNNGIYVILPTIFVLLILELRYREGKILLRLTVLLVACLLPILSGKVLDVIYQPKKGSIAEALSVPFQQTARFVTEYEDEVTPEEKKIIGKILPYDELPALYNPYISDPVKNRYNPEADMEDLKQYLSVWFKHFLREPGCYFLSIWEQNVILLDPGYNNYVYYLGSNADDYSFKNGDYFHTPAVGEKLQSIYGIYLSLLHQLPLLYLINNMALYIIAFLVLGIFILSRRDYKHLIYFLPVLLALLVIIIAPCIRWHVRYSFPIIYSFPLLTGFYTSKTKKGFDSK